MANKIEDVVESVKKALSKWKPASEENRDASQVLVDKLKAMESAYRSKTALPAADLSSIPQTLGLKPKTYTETSEDELLEKAKLAADPGYTGKKDKLTASTQTALTKLEDAARDAQSDYLEDTAKLNAKEKEAGEAVKNRMIEQGLINSSIVETLQSDDKTLFEEQKRAAHAEFEQKTAQIDREITKTRLSFEQALMQYDLQYAADLDAKLSSLKIAQKKLKEEADAYNKKIAEQELRYQKERQQRIAALEEERAAKQAEIDAKTAEYESQYGYSDEKAEEMERRYQLAYQTFAKMDKSDALRLIEEQNAALKETLGLHYPRLIAAFSG